MQRQTNPETLTLTQTTLTEAEDRPVYDPEDIDMETVKRVIDHPLSDDALDDFESRKRMTEIAANINHQESRIEEANDAMRDADPHSEEKRNLQEIVYSLSVRLGELKTEIHVKFCDVPATAGDY